MQFTLGLSSQHRSQCSQWQETLMPHGSRYLSIAKVNFVEDISSPFHPVSMETFHLFIFFVSFGNDIDSPST